MKKIILVLLISLTALLADYVIKEDGTLTKVVDQSTVPETSPTPDQPDSEKWEDITASQAVASKWHSYGDSTIIDNSDYIKITVGTHTKGAYLYIKDIADLAVEGATYEIELQVYSEALIPGAKINLKNLSLQWSDDAKWDLPNNNTTFVHRFVNDLTSDGYISFDGLKEGDVVYVHRAITIKKKLPITYIMPPGYNSWKGATIVFAEPYTYSEVDDLLAVLEDAGVNFIRLQYSGVKIIKNKGITKAQALDLLNDNVKNIYLPLFIKHNMRAFIGGESIPTDSSNCYTKIRNDYWDESKTSCVQDMRDFARFMAMNFKDIDKNVIIGYQIISEPATSGNQEVPGWLKISQELIDIIREYDTEKYIIWSRGPWAHSFNLATTKAFDDNKIIYNVHNYDPIAYVEQGINDRPFGVTYAGSTPGFNKAINELIAFRNANNGIPVIVGAFGVSCWIPDRTEYLNDVLNKITSAKIPSTIFNIGARYKGFDLKYTSTYEGPGTKTNYIYDLSNPAWQRLRKYWKD